MWPFWLDKELEGRVGEFVPLKIIVLDKIFLKKVSYTA